MPNLIHAYRKQKVESQLAKFYSVMNQAIRHSVAEKGQIIIDNKVLQSSHNREYIETWYRENIIKYIKTVKEDGLNDMYYRVIFVDGSGFNSYLSSEGFLYIFYCPDYAKCKFGAFDGINNFLFVYDAVNMVVEPDLRTFSHADKLRNCSEPVGYRHACAALIQENGWKIPDDYPHKI